jgi:hypothetical protein
MLGTLDPASVANSRTLSDAHNPVAVAGLGHPVREVDARADHATLSAPFAAKCDDNGRSFYGTQNICTLMLPQLCGLQAFVLLGRMRPSSSDAVVADRDLQWLRVTLCFSLQ